MASVQFRGSEENGMVAVSNLVSKSSLEARILVGDNLGSVYVVEYNEGKLECSSARAAEVIAYVNLLSVLTSTCCAHDNIGFHTIYSFDFHWRS